MKTFTKEQMVVDDVTHLVDIQVSNRTDVPNIRQQARQILQELGASIQDQAQISWILTYLAQQVIALNNTGMITVNKVEESQRVGLQIICEGKWLLRVGPIYQARMLPIVRHEDQVHYHGGQNPELVVIAWFNSIIDEER